MSEPTPAPATPATTTHVVPGNGLRLHRKRNTENAQGLAVVAFLIDIDNATGDLVRTRVVGVGGKTKKSGKGQEAPLGEYVVDADDQIV
jgi:hypothetical protein